MGQFLFSECIQKVLNNKTRILLTHQLQVLPQCDVIVVVEDGQIVSIGDYESIKNSGVLTNHSANNSNDSNTAVDGHVDGNSTGNGNGNNHSNHTSTPKNKPINTTYGVQSPNRLIQSDLLVNTFLKEQSNQKDVAAKNADSIAAPAGAAVPPVVPSTITTVVAAPAALASSVPATPVAKPAVDANKTALMTREERNVGNVENDIYYYYIKSGGFGWFFLVIFLLITSQAVTVLASFYLAYWGDVTVSREQHNNPLSSKTNLQYLNVYAAISMIGVFLILLRALAVAQHR